MMNSKERIAILEVEEKYKYLEAHLNERSRRIWAAVEAKVFPKAGKTIVHKATGIDYKTIRKGQIEINMPSEERMPLDRIRKLGGGRKRLTEKDPDLLKMLDAMIEPGTRGDPETPLRWTCKSTPKLASELIAQGKKISQRTVVNLLHAQKYSLQSNRKTREGTNHPDRNEQFQFIHDRVKKLQKKHQPVISVDAKKKENVGNFKNNGKEWMPKGKAEMVNMHDFPDKNLGKVTPYGVYDLTKNEGWVNVGIDHDTASFAVDSIRNWWKNLGKNQYTDAKELLITADGGGSNGRRNRLWKVELQKFADEAELIIHVHHFPPGTSKWNKIEHRMFSFISQNWRGRPLLSRAIIVNLIANTTTQTGLKIFAELNEKSYKTGIKISDSEFKSINMQTMTFHPEWNYSILPKC